MTVKRSFEVTGFDPRLRAGGDFLGLGPHDIGDIVSIHASVREATSDVTLIVRARDVSIHASVREATCPIPDR